MALSLIRWLSPRGEMGLQAQVPIVKASLHKFPNMEQFGASSTQKA